MDLQLVFGVLCFIYFGTFALDTSNLEKTFGVTYYTFKKNFPDRPIEIRDVNFEIDSKTVIVVHGYKPETLERSMAVKNALFQYDSSVGRVVVVSWVNYSTFVGELWFFSHKLFRK